MDGDNAGVVGTLMGLTNTFATLPGFIGPAVVGAITYRNVSISVRRSGSACMFLLQLLNNVD